MVRKIFITTLILLLLACSYFSIVIKAETLEEQKEKVQNDKETAENRLQYVQDELSVSHLQIQELDDTIRQAETEMQELENDLEILQEKIDITTIDLNEIEEKYEINEKLLEERIVVMYETGDVTYLEVLFNSANLVDFLSNYYTIQEIVKCDTDLLKQIQEEKDKVEEYKKSLDENKKELRTKKAKAEQLAVINQNNKVKKEKAIQTLSEEELRLQEKIEEYKSEQDRIELFIRLASGEYEYTGDYTGGIMAWPVAKSGTYISSGYGMREHPIQGIIKKHTGIDIANAGYGAPVIAAADGIVTMAGSYGGYGNCVMINHGNGVFTLYGHGQTILTEVGKEVKKGDLIMEVGSTGVSTGPHLHFEVRVNGKIVDPMPYLTGEKSQIEDNDKLNQVIGE